MCPAVHSEQRETGQLDAAGAAEKLDFKINGSRVFSLC